MDKLESDKHSPTVDPNVTKACSGSGAMDWKQFFRRYLRPIGLNDREEE